MLFPTAQSLRIKFLSVYLPWLGVSLVLLIVGLESLNYRNLRSELEAHLDEAAHFSSQSLSVPVWNYDTGSIQASLDALSRYPDFLGGAVYDEADSLLISVGPVTALAQGDLHREVPILHERLGQDATIGRLVLRFHDRHIREQLLQDLITDGIVLLSMALLLLTITLLATRRILLVPLEMLAGSIEHLRATNVRRPVAWDSGDELGQVVKAYNELLDHQDRSEKALREREDQLRQAQKMEAIGQVTGGIAHDFNNLLVVILGYGDMALEDAKKYDDSQLESHLQNVVDAGRNARALIAQLLSFSRTGGGNPEAIRFPQFMDDAIRLLGPTLPSTINLEIELEDDMPPTVSDPVQLQQALLNMCINARDAMNSKGDLNLNVTAVRINDAVCASCHKLISGNYIEFAIHDTGRGIAPEDQARVFEPFFTTKEVGAGSGMGLAMVHGFVHNHGGHVLLKSELGVGTTFCLLLPAHAELGAEDDLDEDQQVDSGEYPSSRRVLVVDDEPMIAEYVQRLLESRGYRVTAVTSSAEALETFENAPRDFDLVITDQTMPTLTGIELAEQILKIQPRVPIFLMTGYPDARVLESAKAAGVRECLSKPLDAKSFRHLVRRYTSVASLGDSSSSAGRAREEES